MRHFDPATSFGPRTAATYDDHLRGDEAETIDFLARQAKRGAILEPAIGTGRIGLSLSQSGFAVTGVEISEAMVAQLRRKPGGIEIPVTIGDFAAVPVDGTFDLIFVVYNTIYNLLTQDDQVRCFENVASRLTSDGVFVIEAEMPTDYVCMRGHQYVAAEAVELDALKLDVARFDLATQILDESHVSISERGIALAPIVT